MHCGKWVLAADISLGSHRHSLATRIPISRTLDKNQYSCSAWRIMLSSSVDESLPFFRLQIPFYALKHALFGKLFVKGVENKYFDDAEDYNCVTMIVMAQPVGVRLDKDLKTHFSIFFPWANIKWIFPRRLICVKKCSNPRPFRWHFRCYSTNIY